MLHTKLNSGGSCREREVMLIRDRAHVRKQDKQAERQENSSYTLFMVLEICECFIRFFCVFLAGVCVRLCVCVSVCVLGCTDSHV